MHHRYCATAQAQFSMPRRCLVARCVSEFVLGMSRTAYREGSGEFARNYSPRADLSCDGDGADHNLYCGIFNSSPSLSAD